MADKHGTTGRLILAPLLLLTWGCAGGAPEPHPHPHMRLDPRLDLAAVVAAIDDWVLATDGGFSPRSVTISDKPNVVYNPAHAGVYTYAGSSWSIEIGDNAPRVAMLHEIGHMLGAGTTVDGDRPGDPGHFVDGLMAPGYSYSGFRPCIDPHTLDIVCSVIACGPDHKPLCPSENSDPTS